MKVLPEETDKGKIIEILEQAIEGMFEKVLTDGFDDLADTQMHSREQKWKWVVRLLQTRGIWTAKKRYILNVHDNEGVRLAEPETQDDGYRNCKVFNTSVGEEKTYRSIQSCNEWKTEQDLWDFVENVAQRVSKLRYLKRLHFLGGCKGLVQYSCPTNIYSKEYTNSCSWFLVVQSPPQEKEYRQTM